VTEEQELLTNIRIVGAQANHFVPNNVCDRDDFMQTGTLALLKAIRKRDPTKGKLTTYSYPIIYRDIKKKQAEKFKTNYTKPDAPRNDFSLPTSHLWEIIPEGMTDQEMKVIELKLDSYNIRQIAKQMGIKCKEVEEIFASACKKIREANLDHA
jgi:RNA polymerase sigma factor (sigma-70 family)